VFDFSVDARIRAQSEWGLRCFNFYQDPGPALACRVQESRSPILTRLTPEIRINPVTCKFYKFGGRATGRGVWMRETECMLDPAPVIKLSEIRRNGIR
jgi:hypothetical protein